jgi:hypothetical protein
MSDLSETTRIQQNPEQRIPPKSSQEPGVDDPDIPPRAFAELREHAQKMRGYWRTRKAIIRGEPLFDYTGVQLRAQGLMGPWKFNATQSFISALAAVFIGRLLAFFYPAPDHPLAAVTGSTFDRLYAYAKPLADEIFAWISTGVAPFTLLLVANIVAWASMWKDDLTPEKKRRAAKAYLYFDSAHGFFSQMLLGVGTVVLVHMGQAANQNTTVAVFVQIIGGFAFVIGIIWQMRLTYLVLARKIFEVNGYSKRRRTMFNIRTRIDNIGPWALYGTVAISGVGAIYWILFGILSLVSLGLGFAIAGVKFATSGL